MSGLAATVTRSTDTCGVTGAGVIGCDAPGGAYRFCAGGEGAFIHESQFPCPAGGGWFGGLGGA